MMVLMTVVKTADAMAATRVGSRAASWESRMVVISGDKSAAD